MQLLLLFLLFSSTCAITCDYLKFMYSDLTCCANNNIDTCLRQIPLCSDTGLLTGDICTDSNNKTVIVGGAAINYTLPVATHNVLGGVKVDGTTITATADGTISSTTYTLPQANETTLGGVKVDGSTITVANDGTITSVNNYTLPAATETTLGGICVDNSSIVVDSYGKISISPTFTSSSTSSFTADIAVDNTTIKQYDNGTIYAVGGGSSSATSTAVVTREGQVLEELIGICDGRSVTISSGTYTLADVTARHDTTNSWTTLPGTEISYKPPTGTTQVIYIFSMVTQSTNTHLIAGLRFFIDNVEVKNLPNIASTYEGGYHEPHHIKFVIDIGSDDVANGKVVSWSTAKTLKIKVKGYSDHTSLTYHASFFENYWDMNDNSATSYIVKPILNIRAIGVQLNYVNFEPTPTALLSAQTFEVTQSECASTALVNSIKAQFATMFPSKSYGTLGNAVSTSTTLPRGCQMFIETYQTDYTRVLFNPATSDPDNALGSGYSAVTFSHRICKYANGDFVLLTDPTARCKTTHFTLPDNLNTLAGVLQTNSTKLGIGVAPEAALHIGLSQNVSINTSRFECDGSGAIIEQTSGKVETIMSRDECLKLPNFEFGVALPGTTATKHADALCKTGDSYQPYSFHYIHVTSGSSSINKLTIEECREFARKNGYSFATGNWPLDPNGCYYHNTNNNIAYFNGALTSNNCGASNYNCVRKLNVKLVTSGKNDGADALTEAECLAWAALTGRWHSYKSLSVLPAGCVQNGPGLGIQNYDHSDSGDAPIYWNSGTPSSRPDCSDSRYCVMRETSLDNPGTPNDQHRVNACRDRCSQPSSKIWSGLTYGVLAYHTTPPFTPASFSVEPTGGECTCHSEPAAICQLEPNNQVDLYKLNWRPKGCFKDPNSVPGTTYHYWTDVDGGVCSEYFPCLRNDEGCLVLDTNNETKPLSLIVEQSAWFKHEVVISSDERIKMNIEKIDNATAILRQIEPRRYEYVDKKKWNGTTVGFIAQQVKEVMPEAVKVEKGFVPNLLQRLACTFGRNNTLKMHCPQLDSGRVRLFVTDDNGESMLDVDVEEGVMKVDRVFTQVYAFGYEVDDFHTLQKSKLFALNFAATQELDRRISALESIINGT